MIELKDKVELCFKKLKSYYYFDNSNLEIRDNIIAYESDNLEQHLSEFTAAILRGDDAFFEKLLSQISFSVVPKTIQSPKAMLSDKQNYYINRVADETEIQITHVNLFIKCSIELHLISSLFLQEIGPRLEKKISPRSFGNRLDLDENYNFQGTNKLFKPYFQEYRMWRDRCIQTSQDSIEKKNNISILNLDLKSFYYNCDFDLDGILQYAEDSVEKYIVKILKKMHSEYNKRIGNPRKSFPIGLLSSAVLANYFMTEFDDEVIAKLNPIYYGRYVDDILIALCIGKIPEHEQRVVEKFLDDVFVKNKIFRKAKKKGKNKNADYVISLKKYETSNLVIQQEKALVHFFDSRGSRALLEKFIEAVKRNSSEFRFLPDDYRDFSFDESSHSLIYKDSSNSYRNIREYSASKFAVSKFFAKFNMLSGLTNRIENKDEQSFEEIMNFFRMGSAVDLFVFWEKAFTTFVLNSCYENIVLLVKQIVMAIDRIRVPSDVVVGGLSAKLVSAKMVKEFLKSHLRFSLIQATSLNVEIISHIDQDLKELGIDEIGKTARLMVRGHYIRHHLSLFPVLNFLKPLSNLDFNYVDRDVNAALRMVSNLDLKISKKIWSDYIIPRFVHYSDIQFLGLMIEIVNISKNDKNGKNIRSKAISIFARYSFVKLNYSNNSESIKKLLPKVKLKKLILPQINSKGAEYRLYEHQLGQKRVDKNTKFGLVNLKIDEVQLLENLLNKPVLSDEKYFEFSKILNESNRNRCDYTVFPECSTPLSWLPLFVNESRRKQISYMLGIEHFEFNGMVFNLMVSVLNFEVEHYNNSYLIFRLKNYPSYEEKRQIEGHSKNIGTNVNFLKLAEPKIPHFDYIIHNSLHFATFNCFELADIQARSIFKSYVDFIVSIENNMDTKYFSSIVDSACRDLHVYIVQVNNSKWGDSRITSPSKSELKDIVKLKGGDNVYLVIDEINILGLRKFQYLNYELQREEGKFKPTPPGFIRILRKKYA